MSETVFTLLLMLAVLWPLLLAAAAAFRITRPLIVWLLPWAALPALATVVIPDTKLQVGAAMLGGTLVLDATGRVFLLLISTLWLATGLLARPRLCAADSCAFAVLLLLAMTGGLGMVLAGDALLFYAATTLAGYALYGVLMHGADAATRQAGRVLIILLVVSDLLVFELLLMLGQSALGMDFVSFRQAFLSAADRGLILGLLVVGFGMKIGLLGAHFWLAPVFLTSGLALRPALIAYMLGAGLLGGLRLLPFGEFDAPVAAEVLQWLAWVTLGYAWLVGLLQAHRRSILAYAAIALGGLWLAVLSAFLQQPWLWEGAADSLAIMLVQSGFALAALLLMATIVGDRYRPWYGKLISGLCWLAALLLAMAPMGIAGALTDRAAAMPIHWAMAVIAFLAAASLVRRDSTVVVPDDRNGASGTASASRTDMHIPIIPVMATALTAAAALAAIYSLLGSSLSETAFAALIVLVSMLSAVVSAKFLIMHLPCLPPGDVLVAIRHGLAVLPHAGQRLTEMGLTRWPDTLRALLRRVWMALPRNAVDEWESALNRWSTALVLVLLLGLLLAWLGGL